MEDQDPARSFLADLPRPRAELFDCHILTRKSTEVAPIEIDLSDVPSPHSLRNRLGRVLWTVVWLLLFRPSPRPFHGWRRCLLRIFGARIGWGCHPHASVRIWAPWNLEMGDYSTLAPFVDCYCVDRIKIGPHATVSQYSYLCSASHDILHPQLRLITAPIEVGAKAWVCADVCIGPGVAVGEGAVVGVRSTVLSDVAPWTVVAGSPAAYVRDRAVS